jgi:hypothetical protein
VELIWPTSTIFGTVLCSMDYFRVNASATGAFYNTVTDARAMLVGVHSVADGAVAVMIAMHAAAANYSPSFFTDRHMSTNRTGSRQYWAAVRADYLHVTGRLTYGSASVRRRPANGLGAVVFLGGFNKTGLSLDGF